jgi:hypothetical protein
LLPITVYSQYGGAYPLQKSSKNRRLWLIAGFVLLLLFATWLTIVITVWKVSTAA